jgi:glycosyltransferase involved in cell wall biosynthesis
MVDKISKTICILPYNPGLGGPASFQSRLIRVLSQRGFTVTRDPLDPANYSILVVGGTRKIAQLLKAKRLGVRIVQRLNGMNWVHRKRKTGFKHYLRSEINNLLLMTIRKMADAVVYQSEFSQSWWNRVYGKCQAETRIIYNGVDLEQFFPLESELPSNVKNRVLIVEGHFGGGYEQGLRTAVQLVDLLNRRLEKRSELMVVGSVPEELKKSVETPGVDILWQGVVKRDEIPAIDRTAHLLFSSDINAACPNSVIEALACGLPVVGYDTGALAELVRSGAGELAPYGSDVWQLGAPDIHSLADAAQKVLTNRLAYSTNARNLAVELFDIQRIADQYIQVLLGE